MPEVRLPPCLPARRPCLPSPDGFWLYCLTRLRPHARLRVRIMPQAAWIVIITLTFAPCLGWLPCGGRSHSPAPRVPTDGEASRGHDLADFETPAFPWIGLPPGCCATLGKCGRHADAPALCATGRPVPMSAVPLDPAQWSRTTTRTSAHPRLAITSTRKPTETTSALPWPPRGAPREFIVIWLPPPPFFGGGSPPPFLRAGCGRGYLSASSPSHLATSPSHVLARPPPCGLIT